MKSNKAQYQNSNQNATKLDEVLGTVTGWVEEKLK